MDVRINGESIVQDGVADIPYSNQYKPGVIKTVNYPFWGSGVGKNSGDTLTLFPATTSMVDERNRSNVSPISVNNLDYAVKAAMCDGKGAAWTADEQAAARERMGIGTSTLVYSYTLTEDVAQFEIPFTEYGDYVVYLYIANNSTHQAEVTSPFGLCMLNIVNKNNPIAVTTGNIMKTSSAPFTWAFSIHVDESIVVCTNSYSVSWNSYAATSYSRFNKNIFGNLEKLIFGLSTAGKRDVYLAGTVVNLYKVV